MKEIEYAKQKHKTFLTEVVSTQFERLKNNNWNSKSKKNRDLFNNVLLPRLDNAIIGLANEDNFEDYETLENGAKTCDVCDKIATIIFKIINDDSSVAIIIDKFIWTFKTVDWFKGIKEKLLYEKIMRTVSKVIKENLKLIND